ncbi:ATP-dependent DNA helicase II subunit 1 [Tulasnella sp. 403]|nr:ATP-dependent DNA helicase II subunit 1 [Tulasnella sp. 403]
MANLRDEWDITADDDDELEDNLYESARETILFCIDASETMHKVQPSRKKKYHKSNLHMALECAADLQKRLVLFNPGTSVGVLLYNTKEKYDGEGEDYSVKEHHQLIQTIKQINAPQIQNLLSIIAEAEEDPAALRNRFEPIERHIPMATVFGCCTGIFRQGAPKTSVKRVFLITDNDHPPNNAHDISVGARTYLDLTEYGATIVPFFLSNRAEPFDITKFYSHVLADLYEGGTIDPVPDPIAGFEELQDEMRIRESIKRALFTTPLHFGEGLTIGVKGYALVMEMKKGPYRKFANMGQRMEDIVGVTTYVDSEQQVEIPKERLLFGLKNSATEEAGEPSKIPRRQPVLFNAEQIREFKTLGIEPGIKILGFKDRETLRLQDNIKHAYFIYPDEKVYSGSTRTFNALLKAMLNRDKVALVRFMPRRGATPSFAVLLPQASLSPPFAFCSRPDLRWGLALNGKAEKVTEQGQQAPPGFHVIALPFADDIREPPVKELKGASVELTDAACQIIGKLTLKGQGYVPDTYLNPALGLHYGFLQATAFNEEFDVEKDFLDTTVPNFEMIHQRAGRQMEAWKELLADDPEASAPIAETTTSAKRKAESSIDEVHVRDFYNDGRTAKLTVAQLKGFCKSKGLSTAGVKAELVERVEDWLANHD